tara:strand:- start:2525 stop:2755 length:231 start_codon:yes stop_codon:yes gene_type:complete
MDRIATCPTVGCDEGKWITVAHVAESWVVDANGNFEYFGDNHGSLDIVSNPDPDNSWECQDCGAEAVFKPINSKKD